MPRRPMTIALDARTLHVPVRRGIARCLVDLYKYVLDQRPDWRVVAFHRGDDAGGIAHERYLPRRIEMPGDRFRAWERWRLPLAARSAGADVLHCPANTCPTWNPLPAIVTINDLLPLSADAAIAQHFLRSVRHAVGKGLTILTGSRFVKQQLVDEFGADPGRIIITPWAARSDLQYVTDGAAKRAAMARHAVTDPFILHFGAPDPRKNTLRLIEAYAALPASIRQGWTLLIVGVNHAGFTAEINELLSRLNVADTVRISGFVDDRDIPALMSAADILAYPSLSEGFGLPTLDAWVTRTAVLSGNATSLPEVAGDAAMCVDATRTDAVRDGLFRLTSDTDLRATLIERGVRRSKQYAWSRTANLFIEAVETTVAGAIVRKPAQAVVATGMGEPLPSR